MILPMPSLEQFGSAEQERGWLDAAADGDPPATPSKPEIQHSPTSGGERKRKNRGVPFAARIFERHPPSWEVETGARTMGRGAAAKADKKD